MCPSKPLRLTLGQPVITRACWEEGTPALLSLTGCDSGPTGARPHPICVVQVGLGPRTLVRGGGHTTTELHPGNAPQYNPPLSR